MTSIQFMVRLPEAVLVGLDQVVEARRDGLQPATRSSLVREIITAYVRTMTSAAPVRSREVRHAR